MKGLEDSLKIQMIVVIGFRKFLLIKMRLPCLRLKPLPSFISFHSRLVISCPKMIRISDVSRKRAGSLVSSPPEVGRRREGRRGAYPGWRACNSLSNCSLMSWNAWVALGVRCTVGRRAGRGRSAYSTSLSTSLSSPSLMSLAFETV